MVRPESEPPGCEVRPPKAGFSGACLSNRRKGNRDGRSTKRTAEEIRPSSVRAPCAAFRAAGRPVASTPGLKGVDTGGPPLARSRFVGQHLYRGAFAGSVGAEVAENFSRLD